MAADNTDLSEFDLEALIEELKENGYIVLDRSDFLDKEELDYIIKLSSNEPIGTFEWQVNEKLRALLLQS